MNKVVIEAGMRGWDLIEYQEIEEYTKDILGKDSVKRHIYTSQLRRLQNLFFDRVTFGRFYFYYSPRTEKNYKSLTAKFDLLITLIFIKIIGCKLIFFLADSNQYSLRLLAKLSSYFGATVLSVIPPAIFKRYDPSLKSIGPYIFPISIKTRNHLSSLQPNVVPKYDLSLMGGLYPERKKIFDSILEDLSTSNLDIHLCERAVKNSRNDPFSYWNEILSSKFVFTTTCQTASDQDTSSLAIGRHNHLVYRFSEVWAAKRILITQVPDSCENICLPGVHYLVASNSSEILDIIQQYSDPVVYNEFVDNAYSHYISLLRLHSPHALLT